MNIWSKFDKQSGLCYSSMISAKPSTGPWIECFELFQDIVEEQKKARENLSLEDLEEASDWSCEFSGWLEDFLDEMDMHREYEKLLPILEYLMSALDWSEGDDFDLKFHKAECLWNTDKEKKAIDFCKEWMTAEQNNYQARTALIYAYMHADKMDEAEILVKEILDTEKECTDDNFIIYNAAEKLYTQKGDKRFANKLKKEIKRYDELVEKEMMEEMMGWEDDEDEDFFSFL